MPATVALIVAAGSGTRAGSPLPKQYASIAGKPVLRRACEALLSHPRIDGVSVVIARGHEQLYQDAVGDLDIQACFTGGDTRHTSVRNALFAMDAGSVLIHDAARPFCPPRVVDSLLDAIEPGASLLGAVPVLPVVDSLARGGSVLGEAVERSELYRVQTPQAFRFGAIKEAYGRFEGSDAGDDATVARAAGMNVACVPGDEALAKLTYPADFAAAEERMRARLIARTGLGFDVHAFAGPGPLVIGGISIPHDRGLTGHSDADVALHALTDALLGAAADGDIGSHFPPSDERWRGAASNLFLEHARDLILARGGAIDHVDVTIICEMPKIGPHREAMRDAIAAVLRIPKARVSVKATTTERLGFAGRSEGIAAQAVATVRMETP